MLPPPRCNRRTCSLPRSGFDAQSRFRQRKSRSGSGRRDHRARHAEHDPRHRDGRGATRKDRTGTKPLSREFRVLCRCHRRQRPPLAPNQSQHCGGCKVVHGQQHGFASSGRSRRATYRVRRIATPDHGTLRRHPDDHRRDERTSSTLRSRPTRALSCNHPFGRSLFQEHTTSHCTGQSHPSPFTRRPHFHSLRIGSFQSERSAHHSRSLSSPSTLYRCRLRTTRHPYQV